MKANITNNSAYSAHRIRKKFEVETKIINRAYEHINMVEYDI